jgi:hypothetical protein
MCSLPEALAVSLFVSGLVSLALAVKLQGCFFRKLATRHRAIWESFGKQGFCSTHESPEAAAQHWYLFAGEYRTINDSELRRSGDWARWISFLAVAMLVVAFGATWMPTYESVFACVPH